MNQGSYISYTEKENDINTENDGNTENEIFIQNVIPVDTSQTTTTTNNYIILRISLLIGLLVTVITLFGILIWYFVVR